MARLCRSRLALCCVLGSLACSMGVAAESSPKELLENWPGYGNRFGWLARTLEWAGVPLDESSEVTLLLPLPTNDTVLPSIEQLATSLPPDVVDELLQQVLSLALLTAYPTEDDLVDVGTVTTAANSTKWVFSKEDNGDVTAVFQGAGSIETTYTVLEGLRTGNSVVYFMDIKLQDNGEPQEVSVSEFLDAANFPSCSQPFFYDASRPLPPVFCIRSNASMPERTVKFRVELAESGSQWTPSGTCSPGSVLDNRELVLGGGRGACFYFDAGNEQPFNLEAEMVALEADPESSSPEDLVREWVLVEPPVGFMDPLEIFGEGGLSVVWVGGDNMQRGKCALRVTDDIPANKTAFCIEQGGAMLGRSVRFGVGGDQEWVGECNPKSVLDGRWYRVGFGSVDCFAFDAGNEGKPLKLQLSMPRLEGGVGAGTLLMDTKVVNSSTAEPFSYFDDRVIVKWIDPNNLRS